MRGRHHETFTPSLPPGALRAGAVRGLCLDRTGFLWLATDRGLHRFDGYDFKVFRHAAGDPGSLGSNDVRSLHLARSGTLWVGTAAGLDRFIAESETFEHIGVAGAVEALAEDDAGSLWVGTAGGGLGLLEPSTAAFRHYRRQGADPAGLSHDDVTALHQDRGGRLWIGTRDGLSRLDPAAGVFVRYTAEAGLSHPRVTAVCGAGGGRLWIGSDGGGLDLLDPDRGVVRTVRHDPDGPQTLSSDRITACWRGVGGELWIGTRDGALDKLIPDADSLAEGDGRTFEPAVVLTDFELGDRSLVPGEVVDGRVPLEASLTSADEIRLTHRDRLIRFQFAALDFKDPEAIQYAYQMVGFDDDWRPVDASHRFATYTNLPPGKYLFQVKGTNSDGVWSRRQASIRVSVAPPLWGTWWFRGLAAAAAAGLALHTYRQRVRRLTGDNEDPDAREAQHSIRPGDPSAPGFEVAARSLSASEVGGDFFDLIRIDGEPTGLCIAIGDVVSKGIRASMAAVMASATVTSTIRAGRALGEVLGSVNEALYQKASPRQFTALCLARLDATRRELHYVNAGLGEPLLKSWQGVRFLDGAERPLPLGAREQITSREERLQLDPGDVLVLYTYGIPESTDAAGEAYGREALERWLETLPTDRMSAREMIDDLLARVRRHARGSRQAEDLTVVVVRAEPEAL